jgi:hypothetical protein
MSFIDLTEPGVIDFDGNGLQWDFLSYPSCDQRLQAHIVNYADDFVIFCHRKTAQAQAHRKDNGQTPKAIYWGILGHDMPAFSYVQKIGKCMMLPASALPAAGILLGVGSANFSWLPPIVSQDHGSIGRPQ